MGRLGHRPFLALWEGSAVLWSCAVLYLQH